MPIRVIIADDHTMFLNGLSVLLNDAEEIEVVGSASNGHGVLDLLESSEADVVVSDLSMPGMDGHELLEALNKEHPDVKMIALSMHDDGKTISKLVKQGVGGYVPKDSDKEELILAITTVASGEKYFGARAQRAVLNDMSPQRDRSTPEKLAQSLTDREKEILVLIAQEYTQDQIADQLFISPNTVVYHKRKLMAVLDVKSVAGLVRKAAEMGLLS